MEKKERYTKGQTSKWNRFERLKDASSMWIFRSFTEVPNRLSLVVHRKSNQINWFHPGCTQFYIHVLNVAAKSPFSIVSIMIDKCAYVLLLFVRVCVCVLTDGLTVPN